MSSVGPEQQRRTRRGPRWSTAIGVVVGLAGLAFVGRTLYQARDEVADALSQARPELLVLAFVLAALGMTGIGLGWHASLRVLGAKLDVASSLRGYFVGQLGKYVPGGVWAIMGRGEWARKEGVTGAVAYTSVLMSMGSAYLAALVVLALSVPLSAATQTDIDGAYLWVLLLLPLGLALIHPGVLKRVQAGVSRITKREIAFIVPPWGASLRVVLLQIPSWLLIGVTSYVLALGIGGRGDPVNLLTATLISWVLGFVALPTPGGLGVREAAFVALATTLPDGIAATVALIARMLFIAVDTAGAAAMTFVVGGHRTKMPVAR